MRVMLIIPVVCFMQYMQASDGIQLPETYTGLRYVPHTAQQQQNRRLLPSVVSMRGSSRTCHQTDSPLASQAAGTGLSMGISPEAVTRDSSELGCDPRVSGTSSDPLLPHSASKDKQTENTCSSHALSAGNAILDCALYPGQRVFEWRSRTIYPALRSDFRREMLPVFRDNQLLMEFMCIFPVSVATSVPMCVYPIPEVIVPAIAAGCIVMACGTCPFGDRHIRDVYLHANALRRDRIIEQQAENFVRRNGLSK